MEFCVIVYLYNICIRLVYIVILIIDKSYMIECFMIVLFLYFDCNRNYVCELVNDCVYVVLIIEN